MAATADVEVALDLQPCEHQAGGHFAHGKDAATYVGNGQFYKVFQDGVRGAREATNYKLMFSEDPEELTKEGLRLEDMLALQQFVPKFFGIVKNDGKNLLALEDSCSSYTKPCVLDCKMGMTTTYDWADDHYKTKNAGKDDATTQSSLGYRVTGFKAWQQDKQEYFVADRKYGKALTPDTMGAALAQFASNGALGPKDVYGGPNGAVALIKQLEAWFESQRSMCFFAASILVIYEGTATKAEDARVQIKFIDFAHSFPSKGQKDENVLAGIKSLVGLMSQVAVKDAEAK